MSIFDKFRKPTKKEEKTAKKEPVIKVAEKEVKIESKKAEIKKEEKLQVKTAMTDKELKEKILSGKEFYGILLRPLITERSTDLTSLNKYVFAVAKEANKIQVAQAILSRYGIKPIKVNILNISGKKVRMGRSFGKRKNWKKAIVTLPEGQTIKLQEGV